MTDAMSGHFKGKVTNSILNMMGLWCQWPLGKTARWRNQAVRSAGPSFLKGVDVKKERCKCPEKYTLN